MELEIYMELEIHMGYETYIMGLEKFGKTRNLQETRRCIKISFE